jgi:hypothetical protein
LTQYHAEDSSVYNGVLNLEITIARSAAEIWPRFLKIGSWVVSHRIEELSSPGRAIGAVTRVSPVAVNLDGYPPPHYHYCKIIKLIPERQYVLKTYSELGGSYGDVQMTAFDDTRFIPVDDTHTKVTFDFYAEFKSATLTDDPGAMDVEGSRQGMMNNLENLKRMVEDAHHT